jgi:hypothetical protein
MDCKTNSVVPEPEMTSIPVDHWDSTRYRGDLHLMRDKFVMEISDQRQMHGQLFASLLPEGSDMDEGLSIALEVNSMPGQDDRHVPCLHVSFGSGNVAFSVFQDSDQKLILRPETKVIIKSGEILPNGEHAYSVEEA